MMFPTLDLRCGENVARRQWNWSRSVCTIWTPEVAKKRSVCRWSRGDCKNKSLRVSYFRNGRGCLRYQLLPHGYICLTQEQQGRLPNSSSSTERLSTWNYKGSRTEDKFNQTICTLKINITQLSLNKPYITPLCSQGRQETRCPHNTDPGF